MENVIIVGAGEVGYYLADYLSRKRSYNVTLLDNSEEQANLADQELNVSVIQANGSSAKELMNVKVDSCDCFMAMTWDDRTNLIACSLAKALGAKQTIARIHDQTYIDQSVLNYEEHFGIDGLVNPESLCAIEIVQPIRNQLRFIMELYAQGEIEVEFLQVDESSKLKGKEIQELDLGSNLRSAYLQRDDRIYVASAQTRIFAGDLLIFFGEPKELRNYEKKYFKKAYTKVKSIVLCGASEIAIAIIRLLQRKHYQVRLIDSSEEKCSYFTKLFPDLTVLHGSPASHRLLEEERVGEADFFIACSSMDEENVMACLQASRLGAQHIQVVLNNSDHEDALRSLSDVIGLKSIVSPRVATLNKVREYLSDEKYSRIGSLPDTHIQIIEIFIGSKSICLNQEIRNIGIPKGCILLGLRRSSEILVPSAEKVLRGEDRLLCLAPEDKIDSLLRVFYNRPVNVDQLFFQKEGIKKTMIA